MSGFWAAGPGWASWVIAGCLTAAGLLVGAWWGWGRGERAAAEEQWWEREQAKARRTYPVYRQRPPEVAHEEYRPPQIPGLGMSVWAPPPRDQETWEAHTGQALTLVRGDLTDSAYTQDMGERMDRFLDDLFRVPYSADELWSGQ